MGLHPAHFFPSPPRSFLLLPKPEISRQLGIAGLGADPSGGGGGGTGWGVGDFDPLLISPLSEAQRVVFFLSCCLVVHDFGIGLTSRLKQQAAADID